MKLCKTFVSQVQIQNNLCKSFSYHRCETRFRQPSVTWSEALCDPFLALPWWRLRIMEKFSQKVGGKNRWYIATSLSLSLSFSLVFSMAYHCHHRQLTNTCNIFLGHGLNLRHPVLRTNRILIWDSVDCSRCQPTFVCLTCTSGSSHLDELFP